MRINRPPPDLWRSIGKASLARFIHAKLTLLARWFKSYTSTPIIANGGDPKNSHVVGDFEKSNFYTMPKTWNPLRQAVMPVVAMKLNGQLCVLGTCFAISPFGVVLTARHVIDELFDEGSYFNPDFSLPDTNQWKKYRGLYVHYNGNEDTGSGLLNVEKIFICRSADVAALFIGLPRKSDTHQLLPLLLMPLSPGLPEVGQSCVGFGYHDAKIETLGPKKYEFDRSFSSSNGVVQQVNKHGVSDGRRYTSFDTDARYPSGTSGGPVVNDDGGVIGIISTSWNLEDETFYSNVVHITMALFGLSIPIPMHLSESKMLAEWARDGKILCDDTAAWTRYRTLPDGSIEVNFGGPSTTPPPDDMLGVWQQVSAPRADQSP